jgi:SAM-dependent methyltransferase
MPGEPDDDTRAEPTSLYGRLATSISLVKSVEFERVLDIGCKSGWLVSSVGGQRWGAGVDVAWDKAGPPRAFPACLADGRHLPFVDASFDLVTIFEVLEHVPKRSEPDLLGEAFRVLRPSGTLLLSTPHRHPVGTALDPAYWIRGHRHYKRDSLGRLLAGAGFEAITMSMGGGLAEAAFVPVFYVFERLPVRLPLRVRWERAIAREYERPGWYTVFASARRPPT